MVKGGQHSCQDGIGEIKWNEPRGWRGVPEFGRSVGRNRAIMEQGGKGRTDGAGVAASEVSSLGYSTQAPVRTLSSRSASFRDLSLEMGWIPTKSMAG